MHEHKKTMGRPHLSDRKIDCDSISSLQASGFWSTLLSKHKSVVDFKKNLASKVSRIENRENV